MRYSNAPATAGTRQAILTLPLASRQREIEREIDELDRGVQLGALVALAMLVSSGSALIVLPAIVARFSPAFLWTGMPPSVVYVVGDAVPLLSSHAASQRECSQIPSGYPVQP